MQIKKIIKSGVRIITVVSCLTLALGMLFSPLTVCAEGKNFLIELAYLDEFGNENDEIVKPGISITLKYDKDEPVFTLFNGGAKLEEKDFARVDRSVAGCTVYYIPSAIGKYTFDLKKGTSENVKISVNKWECPIEIDNAEIRQVNDNIVMTADLVSSYADKNFGYTLAIVPQNDPTSPWIFDCGTFEKGERHISVIIPVHPAGMMAFPSNGKYIPQLIVEDAELYENNSTANEAEDEIETEEEYVEYVKPDKEAFTTYYTWPKTIYVTSGDTISVVNLEESSGEQDATNTDRLDKAQYSDYSLDETISGNEIPENANDANFAEQPKQVTSESESSNSTNGAEKENSASVATQDKNSEKGGTVDINTLVMLGVAAVLGGGMLIIAKRNQKK